MRQPLHRSTGGHHVHHSLRLRHRVRSALAVPSSADRYEQLKPIGPRPVRVVRGRSVDQHHALQDRAEHFGHDERPENRVVTNGLADPSDVPVDKQHGVAVLVVEIDTPDHLSEIIPFLQRQERVARPLRPQVWGMAKELARSVRCHHEHAESCARRHVGQAPVVLRGLPHSAHRTVVPALDSMDARSLHAHIRIRWKAVTAQPQRQVKDRGTLTIRRTQLEVNVALEDALAPSPVDAADHAASLTTRTVGVAAAKSNGEGLLSVPGSVPSPRALRSLLL